MRWLTEQAKHKNTGKKRKIKKVKDFGKGISKQDIKRLELKASKFHNPVWVDKEFTCKVCQKSYNNYLDLESNQYWNIMHGCCSQYCLDKVDYPLSKPLFQE